MSEKPPQFNFPAEMAGVVSQVGCLTVFIIGLALGAGLYLDDLLGNETRILTVIFLLGSAPLSLYIVMKVSLRAMSRVQAAHPPKNEEIETEEPETP